MYPYGKDLDESTTPTEAGLSWVIGKDRRAEGGFTGSERVLDQLKNGPPGGAWDVDLDPPARRTSGVSLSCEWSHTKFSTRRLQHRK